LRAIVDYLKAGSTMLILSEKITPPRRPQIFNDDAAEDAALKKSLDDEEDLWVKQFMADLAGVIRIFGKRK
jgi:hypothetical protein